LQPSSLRAYRSVADHHILPRLGRSKLAALTTPAIERFKTDLIDTTTRETAKRAIIALTAIFNVARQKGVAHHNPAEPVQVRDASSHKLGIGIDVPSDEEVRKLIQ